MHIFLNGSVKNSLIEGYRSRAAYKLDEINKKFKFLKNGISIIDLGAAPGSWSQFILKNFKNVKIASIDLNDFEKIEYCKKLIGDFTDKNFQSKLKEYFQKKIDLVVSDMAVNTTGNKNLDSIQTGELCLEALNFSGDMLKKNGVFVSKIFMGSSFNEIVQNSKKCLKIQIFTNHLQAEKSQRKVSLFVNFYDRSSLFF